MNRELTLTNTVTAKVVGALGCVLLIVAIMAMQAHAQTILIDDFDDGDADGWSIIDTSIDEPWGPGTFDARSVKPGRITASSRRRACSSRGQKFPCCCLG